MERRRSTRYFTKHGSVVTQKCDLPVLNATTFFYMGNIVDISITGFRLQGLRRFALNTLFTVRVLGDRKYGGLVETDFEVPVKCVWDEKHGEFWLSGFEFVDPSPDTIYALHQVIDKLRNDA